MPVLANEARIRPKHKMVFTFIAEFLVPGYSNAKRTNGVLVRDRRYHTVELWAVLSFQERFIDCELPYLMPISMSIFYNRVKIFSILDKPQNLLF